MSEVERGDEPAPGGPRAQATTLAPDRRPGVVGGVALADLDPPPAGRRRLARRGRRPVLAGLAGLGVAAAAGAAAGVAQRPVRRLDAPHAARRVAAQRRHGRRLGGLRQPRRELRQLDGRTHLGRGRARPHAGLPHRRRGGGRHARSPCPTILDTSDPVLHLLRRTTFGLTPELVAEVHAAGIDAWLASQLDPASPSPTPGRRGLGCASRSPAPTPPRSGRRSSRGSWDAGHEFSTATLARQMWSSPPALRGGGGLLGQPPQRADAGPRQLGRRRLVPPGRDPRPRPRQLHRHAASPPAATPPSSATSPPTSRRRTRSTRTTGASCSSCTPSAWRRATPRTTSATAPTS